MAGKDEQAITCIEKAASMLPVYAKGMLDMSEAFLNMGKKTRAEEMVDRFEQRAGHPTSMSMAARARIKIAQHKLVEADTLSRRLVDWNRQPHFMRIRGGVLTEQGKFGEAATIYREILDRSPRNAAANYNMGLVLARQRNSREAEKYYRAALALNPRMTKAHDELGYLMLNSGRPAEAVAYLTEAVKLDPLNVTTLNNLGLALRRHGRPSGALKYYGAALKINPHLGQVHEGLVAALIDSGRLDDAINHCRQALKIQPDWEAVMNLLRKAEEKKRQ